MVRSTGHELACGRLPAAESNELGVNLMKLIGSIRVVLWWAVACTLPAVMVGADDANGISQQPQQERFIVDNRPAFVIRPPKTVSGPTPWVMYAPTLGNAYPGHAETWMFRQFLSRGIAIAGVDVGESFGSPRGRKTYDALHEHLVLKEGFDKRACLLARSRGGLMLYCWAADNPDKVKCIAGIYPVCSLASYPGLKRACGAYGMTESELAAVLSDHNPVDRLQPLAMARVPIFHIHGDVDEVVPLADNSAAVRERYLAAGGSMQLKIARGQGHNMWPGFFECQELVDFVVKHATSK